MQKKCSSAQKQQEKKPDLFQVQELTMHVLNTGRTTMKFLP